VVLRVRAIRNVWLHCSSLSAAGQGRSCSFRIMGLLMLQ